MVKINTIRNITLVPPKALSSPLLTWYDPNALCESSNIYEME